MRLVELIRTRQEGFDVETYVDRYLVENADTEEQAEFLFRKVIDMFFREGDPLHVERAWNYAGDDFNWGDFVSMVPENFMRSFGIHAVEESDKPIVVQVNQDELLIPEWFVEKKFEEQS